MNKVLARLFLVLAFLVCAACTLVGEQSLAPTDLPEPTPDPHNGFWFYEDVNLPAGRDPLFAVCNDKVIRLSQNGDGWDYEHISLEQFKTYAPLSGTGRKSDFDSYIYYPKSGEIWIQKDHRDVTLVQKYINEYNPQHWIWAWSSLIFIKDCRLYIFYVRFNPEDNSVAYRKYPGIDFTG